VEYVDVGALRIAYRREGEGPPVVLLHGGLSDSREWRRQLEDLSHDFTVVAWDAPGCGGSSDPGEGFRLPDYADALASFIRALELDRAHVVGLSFGAGLALALYREHRQLVASLVLASAYAGWAGSLPPEVVDERLRDVLRQADLPADEVVAESLPSLFAGAAQQDTLLLYGEADQRLPLSAAEELHAAIPDSGLVVLDGVGHQSNMEAADRFNAEVRRFLRSVSSDRRRAAP
jgi:pimeloyl-ACP methyl ester carboxylesterase